MVIGEVNIEGEVEVRGSALQQYMYNWIKIQQKSRILTKYGTMATFIDFPLPLLAS